jgi:hypothetical protein
MGDAHTGSEAAPRSVRPRRVRDRIEAGVAFLVAVALVTLGVVLFLTPLALMIVGAVTVIRWLLD